MLVRNERLCIWNSPFLDPNGEEDPGCARGKRMQLHWGRWEGLCSLWFRHELNYDSRVLQRSLWGAWPEGNVAM
jgi:hypothetical protein